MQLYTNASIYQGSTTEWAEAIVVDGAGMILGVGELVRLRERYPNALESDLDGGYLFPGFIDCHSHPSIICREIRDPNLSDLKTWRQASTHIRDYINAHSGREWYVVFGWDEERWGRLKASDLDAISSEKPIFLVHSSYHQGILNTPGLENIHRTGMRLRHDHGLVTEQDYRMAQAATLPSYDELLTLIPRYHQQLRANGITTVHDMLLMNIDQLRAYVTLDQAGLLQTETIVYLHELLLAHPDIDEYVHYAGRHLTIGGGKAFLDGAISLHSALLYEPYLDGQGDRGLASLSTQHLLSIISTAAGKGLRSFAVHAIGDAAITRALDAFEEFESQHNLPMQWRIEHAEIISPQDIERMALMGVTAVIQPSFIRDMNRFALSLGDRIHRINPLRELLDAGVSVAFGSEDQWRGPLPSLDMATKKILGQHQRITRHEGIELFTTAGAKLSRIDQFIGDLSVGKRADMVLLDHNPFTYRWGLEYLKVKQTWFAGIQQIQGGLDEE